MRYNSIKINQAFALSLIAFSLGLSQASTAQMPQPAGVPGQAHPAGQANGPRVERTMAKEVMMRRTEIPKTSNKPPIDTFGKPIILTADKAQFDDLPNYTGKMTFESGGAFAPGGRNGQLMVCTYKIAEPREQVKDWYSNALRMYGWNITFQSKTVLNATHSKTGNTLALQFADQDSKRRSSTLQIDYHWAQHQ